MNPKNEPTRPTTDDLANEILWLRDDLEALRKELAELAAELAPVLRTLRHRSAAAGYWRDRYEHDDVA